MPYEVEKIFLPSVGVDLVLDMDSLTPVSRSSIIYDTDHDNRTITVAQPNIPITGRTKFKQFHLTTILFARQQRVRVGIACKPIQYLDQYRLANNATTQALILQYTLPPVETNIRSAFRLPLSGQYTIKAKLLYEEREYLTPRDFKIKDISFAGIGLVVPKMVETFRNPLAQMAVGAKVPVGMILIDTEQKKPMGKFPVQTKVVRSNAKYLETHTLVGLHIQAIAQENEAVLNRFIHNAQIAELKRMSKRD